MNVITQQGSGLDTWIDIELAPFLHKYYLIDEHLLSELIDRARLRVSSNTETKVSSEDGLAVGVHAVQRRFMACRDGPFPRPTLSEEQLTRPEYVAGVLIKYFMTHDCLDLAKLSHKGYVSYLRLLLCNH